MISLASIKNSIIKSFQISEFNIIVSGLLGFIGHPLYWAFWTYLFPQEYDSAILRFSSSFLCFSFLFKKYWPDFLKKYFYFCWFLCVAYILPFLFTVHLILNHFSDIWLMCETGMFFIVVIFLPNFILMTINLVIGIACAILYCALIRPDIVIINSEYLQYLPIFAFAIFAGFIFSYSSILGAKAHEKARIFKSLAGSIAHELRNPLNTINLAQNQSDELLSEALPTNINQNLKEELSNINSSISSSVIQANNTINIILADLGNKPIEPSDFSYLSTDKVLPEIVKTFGYRNLEEKEKVKLDLKDNFVFKAVNDRFVFIVYNLLKNALYYLNQYPDSVVTVGVETSSSAVTLNSSSTVVLNSPTVILNEVKDLKQRGQSHEVLRSAQDDKMVDHDNRRVAQDNKGGVDYSKYNVIYVHDTGPGIPSHIIPKLFGDFFTSGKKDGTGLGLAFCKRNMKIFDGDIILESELGEEGKNGWTKFSLLFPKLSEEEIKQAETEAKRRKILIVDDQETNLIAVKLKIEQNLKNIICDIALSGKEAIKLVKENKYHLILMDIQMPEMNGIKTAKEIRKFNKDIPVIAFTSLSYDSFLKEINNSIAESDFNYCLNKSAPSNILCRTIIKWITDINDNFSYLGNKEQYQTALQNKNILLADDQEINLMMTKRNLERNGLRVTTAKDGRELLEIYKNSLDEEGKSSFDLILADINMPPYDGDEAAKAIRAIELSNNLQYKNIIPIIAISGDGRKEDIYYFFSCQITDYFIKGNDPELLTGIVASYLVKKDNKTEEQQIEFELDKIIIEKEKMIHQLLDLEKINCFDKSDQKMIMELFLKEGTKIITLIKDNINADLHFNIHSLKGISGNIGASRLFEYTKEIDAYFKQNKPIENENWMKELEEIYEETMVEVEKFLSGLR